MTTARKIINAIRGKKEKKPKPRDPIDDRLALAMAQVVRDDQNEAGKAVVRDRAFAKAQAALEEKRAREKEIKETRLANLEKARKAKAKQQKEQKNE